MSRKRFDRWYQIPARVTIQHHLFANHCEGLAQAVLALEHLVFRLDHRQFGGGVVVIYGGKNSHIEALNFSPNFILADECKVSRVSVQDMLLHLPFLTPETRHQTILIVV
jgi:hypothetical protein